MPDDGRIVVSNLTKYFGKVRVVDDLSFEVESGTVTGFLGPNGAGKTTTLRCLLGLVTPTKGTANGLDPAGINWLREFLRYLATTQHKTVLISSHVLSEVEQTVDSVVIIAQGRLIREGTLKDLLITALTAGGTGGNNGQATPPLSDPAQVRTVYGTAFGIGSLFTLILGVIAICGEFRHQTITPTFLATPRRNRVGQAKVAGVVIAGGLSGILMIATGLLVGAIVISARGFGTRLGSGDVQQPPPSAPSSPSAGT